MLRLVRRFAWLALLPVFAAPAAAQLAQSADVQLTALTLDGAGGDIASLGIDSHLVLGEISGGELASSHYRASVGFLVGDAPHAVITPVIYGVEPGFGPMAGRTAIAVTGSHFDSLVAGGGVLVTLGGHPATDVDVHSASLLTLLTPPGVSGPSDLVISGGQASAMREAVFVYTPALLTTPVVAPGGVIEVRNLGPPGDAFITFVSLEAWNAPTRYGTQLVGPACFQLFAPKRYPAPDGVSSIPFRLPALSQLSGLVLHFQSLSVSHVPPFAGQLTNASTVTVP